MIVQVDSIAIHARVHHADRLIIIEVYSLSKTIAETLRSQRLKIISFNFESTGVRWYFSFQSYHIGSNTALNINKLLLSVTVRDIIKSIFDSTALTRYDEMGFSSVNS